MAAQNVFDTMNPPTRGANGDVAVPAMREASGAGVTRRQALGLLAATLGAGALGGLAGGRPAWATDASAPSDGGAAAGPAKPSGTLRMAISVDPDGLDPQRTAAASTFQVTSNLYDPLLTVTTAGEVQPGLAESWDVSDDGLTITFHLRGGVTFSNGNSCDAAAVVASLQRLQADDSPRKDDYAGFTFEAQGDDTVVVTMNELNVAALTNFAYPWVGIVDVSAADTLRNQPVGTGAFALESWTPQQGLELVANEGWWGGAPHVERVSMRVMPDATSRVTSLRAGEIDFAIVSADQVAQFQSDTNFSVVNEPMNGVQLMAMNVKNEALADARVRQAINHAVDKQQLIDTVWWGQGAKIGSHYPVGLKEYVDTNDMYPYDVEKAKALLKEAGYEGGLTLGMKLPKSYPEYVSAGQVIADFLSKVGITCDIEIIEWATWLQDVYTDRNYDLTVVGHTGRLDPYVLLARYASDADTNYFNYASDDVDAMIKSFEGEPDEAKRTAIVQDIQRTLATDVPALYIQDPNTTYVTSAKVSGFAVYPIDIYVLKDVTVSA